MNTLLWILAGLLAAAFAASGLSKLAQSREKLIDSGQKWAADVPAALIKTVGGLEVAGAVGLVVPPLLDTAEVLVPLAAVGLGLLMIGAAALHARRKEPVNVAVNAVLLSLAAVVAWGRFGPYDF